MIDLIKKLFEHRNKKITMILLDDSMPGEDNSYRINPSGLFMLTLGFAGLFSLIVAFIFMLTPIGGLLYSSDQAKIRNQIVDVTERTLALEDSLQKRDTQLREMKNVIRLSVDTTLAIDERFISALNDGNFDQPTALPGIDDYESVDQINQYEILSAGVLKSAPVFPTRYPVKGTLTRGYLPEEDHFGIDIATKKDEPIINIADGSVFSSSWTISNGYVISIQHKDGLLTTYKHLSKLNKKEGDIVLKGDILGTTGDIGVLSTGTHLHFELWKNGVSQNPQLYLIK